MCQLRESFSGSAGLQQYSKLERVLVRGTMDDEHTSILSMYLEIDVGDLKAQLQNFTNVSAQTHCQYSGTSSG